MDATGYVPPLLPARRLPTPSSATRPPNDTALALRGDVDFIAGYASNAMLVYVHPLSPDPQRTRVGLAITDTAVVAFFDGDRITVLPPTSAPLSAPGAP